MSNMNKDLPQFFFPVTHPDSWKVFSLKKKPVRLSYYCPAYSICSTDGKKEWSQSRYVYVEQSHSGTLPRSMCKDQKHCGVGVGFLPRDISSSCFLPDKWNLEHRISPLICIDSRTDLLGCYFSLMVIWSKWIIASILAVYFLLFGRGQIARFYLYLYRIQTIFFLLYRLFKSN